MDILLSSTSTCSKFDVQSKEAFLLLCAIKDNKLDRVKRYLSKKKILVNIPIITSGSLAGYTALHIACLQDNLDLVKMLVENFKADVNAVAADGAQPLILAGLLGHRGIVKILLRANANVDAEFGQEIQSKFVKDGVWSNDFGDKITLAIFAIMNDKNKLMENLKFHGDPYLNFISKSNKTLLMYAIERDNYDTAEWLVDSDLVNIRDNEGISAIHYLVHEKRYGEFRYNEKQLILEFQRDPLVMTLIYNGADIHSTINGDPKTFLLNSAAYRGACAIFLEAVPHYDFITQSRALYYATLPMTDREKFLSKSNDERYSVPKPVEQLKYNRWQTIELILKDLVNRRTFGFAVPEEEKQLMDKLIATNSDVKDFVTNYEKTIIHGLLKIDVIHFGDKSMTLFDFFMEVGASEKKLRFFVEDEKFITELFDKIGYFNTHDAKEYCWFLIMYQRKVTNIKERMELLEKLRKVSQLRKYIPLPYELVLEIIEYLNNNDLEKFINSFYNE